jgi:hypothetical protein
MQGLCSCCRVQLLLTGLLVTIKISSHRPMTDGLLVSKVI